jgi:hypothetical protein
MISTAEKDLIVPIDDFGISQREIDLIRSHAPVLEGRVAAIADAYYAHLGRTAFGRLLSGERVDQLKATRIGHWRLLLKADFAAVQDDYLEHIGPRLLETGFPPSIFVVAADWFAVEFGRFIEKSMDIPRTIKHDLRTAVLKLAFHDLALAQAAREITYLD